MSEVEKRLSAREYLQETNKILKANRNKKIDGMSKAIEALRTTKCVCCNAEPLVIEGIILQLKDLIEIEEANA